MREGCDAPPMRHALIRGCGEAATPRDIAPGDRDALLALNRAHATELSPLAAAGLDALLQGAFHARAVGEDVDAFMIALDETHPSYQSPNYLWFRTRWTRFVYVDRLAVDARMRGRGYARLLYADLIARAAAAGHAVVGCEVNADPPNPASDALHASLGFCEVGQAALDGGAKTVRYLALPVGGGDTT